MEPLGLLKTFRKLQAFLAGLLPRVAVGSRVGAALRRLVALPPLPALGRWVASTRVYSAAAVVARRFVWRDHSGDRLDPGALPSGIGPVLRGTLSFVALALFAVLYARSCSWPALAVDGVGFEVRQLTALTHYLVLAGIALGWSALLAGASRTNGWAMAAGGLVFLYLMVPLGLAAPWRGLLLVPALLLLWFVRHSTLERGPRLALGLGAGFVVGFALCRALRGTPGWVPLAAACAVVALLALFASFRSSARRGSAPSLRAPALAGVAALAGGAQRVLALLGLAAATRLALAVAGGWLWHDLPPPSWPDLALQVPLMALGLELCLEPPRRRAPLGRAVLLAFLGLLVFLAATQVLSDHRTLMAAMRLHLEAFDGTLWGVWYLIGVGIVFKLLKETRALTQATEILLPGRWLPVAGVALLSAVALLGFGGEILWAVARIWPWKGAWLVELHRAWLWLGQAPAWFETLMIMRWVVLWGLLALLYLRVRGRLERDVGVALGFLLLLALVTVYEYHFELHAFRRSGAADRVVAPFLFGAWILWLCYSVGMRAASGDSPRWSREGRTGLYAGGMVLVATALHLAAVALASTLADRTFLQLFLGLMHVGIPYALYVYLGKRHAAERPSTARLLGAFLLGIATHVPVLLLTKLALGGYTTAGFLGVVETVRESLLTRGFGPEDLSAPDAPGFVALAVSVGFACRLLALAAVRPGPVTAAAVFLGYGVGGVMPLSLPLLPSSVMAALLPLERHLTLTLSLASHHALHLLLALTVAGLYRLRGRSGLATGLAVAFMLELGVTLLSVVGGDYLRSTGLSWSLLVAVAGAAGLLLWRINRLSGEGTLVPASHVWVVVGVGLVAVLGASARSAYRHRLLPARIGDVSFGVPAPWKRLPRPPPGVAQAWTRHHAGGAALLLVSVEPLAAGATLSAHLEGADRQLAATVRGFRVLRSRGGPDRRRRRVQLRLPGDRWPRKGEQLVLRRRGTAISWAYLAPTLSFQALLPDARRVLASVDARQVLTTLER